MADPIVISSGCVGFGVMAFVANNLYGRIKEVRSESLGFKAEAKENLSKKVNIDICNILHQQTVEAVQRAEKAYQDQKNAHYILAEAVNKMDKKIDRLIDRGAE